MKSRKYKGGKAFVGPPYEPGNTNTWGQTNYYKLNDDTIFLPKQTRIGGKRNKKTKKNKKKNNRRKKGGTIMDERFVLPFTNTIRNGMDSITNAYRNVHGDYPLISSSPMVQTLQK